MVGGLLAGAAGVAAWHWWPEDGWTNPCEDAALPDALRSDPRYAAAWRGIDPAQMWDMHVHVGGNAPPGAWVNRDAQRIVNSGAWLRRWFYEDAACIRGMGLSASAFTARLVGQIAAFPPGARALVLAFDAYHDEAGIARPELSLFQVTNAYAAALAAAYPERIGWIASIHPYRPDAVEALEAAAASGARAVKWLPPAMGMDPASARCDRFYEALARLRLPLMSHGGDEHAVPASERQALGNPLRLRRPLEHGVRVIVTHCASAGFGVDLDEGRGGARVANFELFARLMDDERYRTLLWGDVSAMAQVNRMGVALATVLERGEWHDRLLYGSDYPLPGVMPLHSLRRLVAHGFLDAAAVPLLNATRRHNALMFSFLLFRHLERNGRRLAAQVFETRRAFEPPATGDGA